MTSRECFIGLYSKDRKKEYKEEQNRILRRAVELEEIDPGNVETLSLV